MFNPFPKNLPSFMPIGSTKDDPVPAPPNRKSSCTKATVKTLIGKCKSNLSTINNNRDNRHVQCFKKSEDAKINNNKYGTITLRSQKSNQNERICRSKSAGAVTKALSTLLSNCGPNKTSRNTSSVIKRPIEPVRIARIERHTRINDATSPTRRRMLALRQTSLSPVAFGRSISRERTFAEEKKRLENTLPLSRTTFEASTNILRDPALKSPQDVKKAVLCYATCPVRMRSKSLPRIKEITYTPNVSINTTTRHTMCYPHVHESKIIKTVRPLTKTTTFSNCRKVPTSYNSAKFKSKTDSTISLARTNSTFSVESKEKTSKGISKTKNCNKTSKPLQVKSIHNSRSDSNIFPKRSQQNTTNKDGKINTKALEMPSKVVAKTSYFPEPVTCMLETKSLKHEIPYKHQQYESYERTRSVSPLKHHQHEENTNQGYADNEEIFSEFGEQTDNIDNLLWQYEINNKKEGYFKIPEPIKDISRHESPSPTAGKIRKFSPTREIRVPPEEARPTTPFIDWSPKRPVSPMQRKFSPTREIRVPHTPRSCSPMEYTVILPVQSSTSADETFLPTREVRVPPTNRNVRSPSRRKIDSCRTHIKNVETSKIIRASSLSSADNERVERGLYRCSELAHSATSLSCHERHSPTCRYRQHSERFTDLNRFYNTLERVGQLERATSTTNFKPIRKESDLLDFDEWRQVRFHERAEKELNYLVQKLKQDQKEKDLIFRAKDVDDIKWRRETDFSLHSLKKSVEDLREDFEKKQLFKEFEYFSGLQPEREYVRPYYRRNTVADLASSLEHKMHLESDQSNNQLVSTLSKDEKYKISKQLNEIYSNNKQAIAEEFVVTVDENSKRDHALKVRCNSSLSKDDLIGPVLRKKLALAGTSSLQTMDNESKEKHQRSTSPVHLARETRGATAAKNADVKYSKLPEIPPLPLPESNSANNKLAAISHENVGLSTLEQKDANKQICKKIHYFESRKFDEPPKTVYHAREDSSPDENEVLKMIEKNMKTRAKEKEKTQELSSSLTDLKELFGERNTARVSFYRSVNTQNSSNMLQIEDSRTNHENELSPPMSLELCESLYRSRSLSPNSETSSYLSRIHTGEVQKIKEKFESLNEQQLQNDFFGVAKLRKARSDSELSIPDSGSKDALEISSVNVEEFQNKNADSWRTQKMNEVEQMFNYDETRGRSRKRRVISPIPLKNRLMPHIDNISKRAALNEECNRLSKVSQIAKSIVPNDTGLVDRMRTHYEYTGANYISLSNPDVSDANHGTKHLTADWIAHKFPSPKQNTYLANNRQLKDIDIFKAPSKMKRSSSTSPTRPPKSHRHQTSTTLTSCLKPYFGDDIFANQKYDPSKHKPKARYVPDGAETNDWKKSLPSSLTIVGGSSTITFQGGIDLDYAPSIPPPPRTAPGGLNVPIGAQPGEL